MATTLMGNQKNKGKVPLNTEIKIPAVREVPPAEVCGQCEDEGGHPESPRELAPAPASFLLRLSPSLSSGSLVPEDIREVQLQCTIPGRVLNPGS